jgi:hypothetical protein
MAYYAWTDIHYSSNKKRLTVKAGAEVSAQKLGIDEEEWDQLVEARVVRTIKYPNMPASFTGSPKDFVLKQRSEQLQQLEDLDLYADDNEVVEVVQEKEEETNDDNKVKDPSTSVGD